MLYGTTPNSGEREVTKITFGDLRCLCDSNSSDKQLYFGCVMPTDEISSSLHVFVHFCSTVLLVELWVLADEVTWLSDLL